MIKKVIIKKVILGLFLSLFLQCFSGQSKFVILIASYNNVKWVEQNVLSVINQRYNQFRVIYVDDASTDGTNELLRQILEREKKANLVKIIRNEERKGSPLPNHYYAIHNEIADDEIVVLLDGDDLLAHDTVLKHLDRVYSCNDRRVWLTYGQFKGMTSGDIGFCSEFPKEIVEENLFRKYVHMPSHLKTFYAWLFKKIRKEDLFYEGDFYKMTGDLALMLPMIEMAKNHYKFISQVLYIYNESNDISDHRINWELQMDLARYIRSLPSYQPLD